MAVTIKEVADRAGVSPATVSRVIHNNSRISAATKRIVRDAMRDLGYTPNAAARSLAGKAPRTLGLVLPSNSEELFDNPFFISVMRGISVYAQKRGYFHMYAFSKDEEEEVEFLQRYISSGWVSGIVLLTAREKDRCVSFLKEAEFPFVVIGRPEETEGVLWTDNDNFQAMYHVTSHLLETGCRAPAFLGGPGSFRVTRDRLAGFRRALEAHGLDCPDERIALAEGFSEEEGKRACARLLESSPDAVASTDDQLAFGALELLRERGRGNARVTGFNNTKRGLYQSPSLTTVDVRPEELGRRAAELIVSRLEGESGRPDHFIVDTSLILRESSLSGG